MSKVDPDPALFCLAIPIEPHCQADSDRGERRHPLELTHVEPAQVDDDVPPRVDELYRHYQPALHGADERGHLRRAAAEVDT